MARRPARPPPGRGHRAADAGRGPARRPGHHLVEQAEPVGRRSNCPPNPLVPLRRQPLLPRHGRRGRARGRGAARTSTSTEPLAITGAAREYPVAAEVRRGGPQARRASGSTSRSRSGGTCRSGWRAGRSIRSGWPTTTCAATRCTRARRGASRGSSSGCRPRSGNGYWSQEIYYHLLNCGLRLPPSAGSASGVLPNPVGYNRVYVHVGQGVDVGEVVGGAAGRPVVRHQRPAAARAGRRRAARPRLHRRRRARR